MKKFVLTLLCVFLSAFAAFSQKPQPTATPTAVDDEDIVKISTNLIQVDVTVTDSKGNAVNDLTIEDFEIYENGKKQDISNFSFISGGLRKTQVAERSKDSKNPIFPPPTIRPEQVRRTIALVVDDLTLSFESMYQVRRALKKFVDEQMQDGDLVAIIRTGAGIGALQQFTSDKRMLYAAIERVKWNAGGTGNIGAFATIESQPQNTNLREEIDGDDGEEDAPDSIADLNDFRESLFATGTLGAVNYIVRGMKELPGRKSVMLLSDGFKITNLNQNQRSLADSTRVLDALKKLVDLANRSSVVIYTMDARGLQVTGITAADDVSDLTAEQISEKISERSNKLFDTQEGLIYLAKQTGGLPIYNNNDLSSGIERMLDDQSYYLIGYQPNDDLFDPAKRRFNKLEIKVKRPNTKVRYRSGFFGISDEEIQKPVAQNPIQRISDALSSPFGVGDIALSLNTVFNADAQYHTSLSSFLHISAKDLKFTDQPNGDKRAIFDILAVNFGDNGAIIEQVGKTYTIDVKKEVFEKHLKNGFVYFFTFPVKKPGAYQMRVAIRDHATDKLGAASQFVEVPKLKNKRLTLSGVALENLSFEDWTKEEQLKQRAATDPMTDTALRVFKRGTVLRYGYDIYNAKFSAGQKPQLQMRSRIFRDGKQIYESQASPVNLDGQTNFQTVKSAGALALGTEMQNGEYVLQIIITDAQAKKKNQIATQFVQFEIVN